MEKKCPACDAVLPEGVKFCIICGNPLAEKSNDNFIEDKSKALNPVISTGTCPKCEQKVPDNTLYCIHCGFKLDNSTSTKQASPTASSEIIKKSLQKQLNVPSSKPITQNYKETLVDKIQASKKNIAEKRKSILIDNKQKQQLIEEEQLNQSKQKPTKSSFKKILTVCVFIILALLLFAGLKSDKNNKRDAKSKTPSVTTSNQIEQNTHVAEKNKTKDKTEPPADNKTRVDSKTTNTKQGQIAGTNAKMREYPSLNGRVVFTFPGGETVTIHEETEAKPGKLPWYGVSYKSSKVSVYGWVYGQFIKLQTSTSQQTVNVIEQKVAKQEIAVSQQKEEPKTSVKLKNTEQQRLKEKKEEYAKLHSSYSYIQLKQKPDVNGPTVGFGSKGDIYKITGKATSPYPPYSPVLWVGVEHPIYGKCWVWSENVEGDSGSFSAPRYTEKYKIIRESASVIRTILPGQRFNEKTDGKQGTNIYEKPDRNSQVLRTIGSRGSTYALYYSEILQINSELWYWGKNVGTEGWFNAEDIVFSLW